MFTHGKTNRKYYSVREKIKYYSKRAFNDKNVTPTQKQHAIRRLAELKALNKESYDEPMMIVTDDKHFGNAMSKPRLGVVIAADNKDRVLVASVNKRSTKAVILDNDITRQVDERKVWISRDEIYEAKYIENAAPLTENDKNKIKKILRKK